MNTLLNRSVCLANWKGGAVTVMFSRFTHRAGNLEKSYINFHKSITLSSLKRLDRVLQQYKNTRVYASVNEERTMLTATWDDLLLTNGMTLSRWEFGDYKEAFQFSLDH